MDASKTRKRVNASNASVLSTKARQGSEAKYRLLIDHYAKNGKLERACKAAGIDHSTHWRRMQSDPKYREVVEEAGQQSAQVVEDTVYDLAVAGEQWAAMAILRKFRPGDYRDRSSIDVALTVDLVQRIQEGHQRVIEMRKATDVVDRVG